MASQAQPESTGHVVSPLDDSKPLSLRSTTRASSNAASITTNSDQQQHQQHIPLKPTHPHLSQVGHTKDVPIPVQPVVVTTSDSYPLSKDAHVHQTRDGESAHQNQDSTSHQNQDSTSHQNQDSTSHQNQDSTSHQNQDSSTTSHETPDSTSHQTEPSSPNQQESLDRGSVPELNQNFDIGQVVEEVDSGAVGTKRSAEEMLTTGEIAKKRGRFIWSEDLHRQFLASIFEFGLKQCTPKSLLGLMPNKPSDITTEHVKSHLQKFRLSTKRARAAFMKEFDTMLSASTRRGNFQNPGFCSPISPSSVTKKTPPANAPMQQQLDVGHCHVVAPNPPQYLHQQASPVLVAHAMNPQRGGDIMHQRKPNQTYAAPPSLVPNAPAQVEQQSTSQQRTETTRKNPNANLQTVHQVPIPHPNAAIHVQPRQMQNHHNAYANPMILYAATPEAPHYTPVGQGAAGHQPQWMFGNQRHIAVAMPQHIQTVAHQPYPHHPAQIRYRPPVQVFPHGVQSQPPTQPPHSAPQ